MQLHHHKGPLSLHDTHMYYAIIVDVKKDGPNKIKNTHKTSASSKRVVLQGRVCGHRGKQVAR